MINIISKNANVPILNDAIDKAYYSVGEDKIHLPPKNYFVSSNAYNSTALHELAHASGSEKSLNRNIKNIFASEDYAFEELVAEITSAFMACELSSDMDKDTNIFKNHKAYISSWIKAINDKPNTLIKAIKEAERASDYLCYQADLINEIEYIKRVGKVQELKKKKQEENIILETKSISIIM